MKNSRVEIWAPGCEDAEGTAGRVYLSPAGFQGGAGPPGETYHVPGRGRQGEEARWEGLPATREEMGKTTRLETQKGKPLRSA